MPAATFAPMRITLLRHGETTHNAVRMWQGHLAGELSDTGKDQARALRARFASDPFDLVISSDLARAEETAELASVDAVPNPAWREIDVGDWAGRTHEEVWAEDQETVLAMRRGEAVPLGKTGETLRGFSARVQAAFDALAGQLDDEQSALVVTHGGVIWSLVSSHWGMSFPNRQMSSVLNTSLATFEYRFGAWRLASYNDAGHLGRGTGLKDLVAGDRVVTLVRHGQTDANVRQIWQGQTDWGLNDHGRIQATTLASWYGDPGRVVSSPLGRALQTASALNGSAPASHVGLMEMSMGLWENLGVDAIKEGWPDLFKSIYEGDADERRGVTGESVDDLIRRMEATVSEIVANEPGDLTVVSHGSAIRAYVVSVLGGTYERFRATGLLPNTGLSEVVIGAKGPRLHSYGVAAHLDAF